MFCLLTSGVEPVFGDVRSVGDHLVTVYEQTTSALASPQTSFGVRLSRIHFSPRMRDKRTPKDVCGEATIKVEEQGKRWTAIKV